MRNNRKLNIRNTNIAFSVHSPVWVTVFFFRIFFISNYFCIKDLLLYFSLNWSLTFSSYLTTDSLIMQFPICLMTLSSSVVNKQWLPLHLFSSLPIVTFIIFFQAIIYPMYCMPTDVCPPEDTLYRGCVLWTLNRCPCPTIAVAFV